jgi:hypothetical protein
VADGGGVVVGVACCEALAVCGGGLVLICCGLCHVFHV